MTTTPQMTTDTVALFPLTDGGFVRVRRYNTGGGFWVGQIDGDGYCVASGGFDTVAEAMTFALDRAGYLAQIAETIR
jgi:hypothetical protein